MPGYARCSNETQSSVCIIPGVTRSNGNLTTSPYYQHTLVIIKYVIVYSKEYMIRHVRARPDEAAEPEIALARRSQHTIGMQVDPTRTGEDVVSIYTKLYKVGLSF